MITRKEKQHFEQRSLHKTFREGVRGLGGSARRVKVINQEKFPTTFQPNHRQPKLTSTRRQREEEEQKDKFLRLERKH